MTIGTLLVVALALRVFPRLWTITIERVGHTRIQSLDGARGLLTIWVLSYHLLMSNAVDASGVWHAPAGALGVLMVSGFFVAPFFMLTAMLFGGRLVRTGGKLEAAPFFISRAFRLIPAYTVAVMLLVLGAFVASGFEMQVGILQLLKQIGRWMLFDFVARYDINDVDMSVQYGVLWTLRYEIIFYATLPIIAFAQRRLKSRLLPIPVFLVLGYFMWPFLFFVAGTVAAVVVPSLTGARARLACQILAVAGIATIVVCAMSGYTSSAMQALLLIPIFICLALETALVRPLRWRPLRLIGEISYSNYVLHGAVLYLIGATIVDLAWVMQLPIVPRIGTFVVLEVAALSCALLCFLVVEQPFNRLGAKLSRRFAKVSGPAPAAAGQALAQSS